MSNVTRAARERSDHLVVVGASAGGIEALSAFVSGLPADFPAPIVIAQHLSRHRSSSLASILQNRSALDVQTVETTARLTPGTVYVVPSNRDVLVADHEVSVVDTSSSDGNPSVNLLFRSAAQAYAENLIAIVLSGTGSDGAAGAQEVKNAGGTIIIQDPETAAFPGMPRSLPPVIVDLIAEPSRMGALLEELISSSAERLSSEQDSQIRGFLVALRDEDGIDFTSYKQPTIRRRLQRRMTATGHRAFPEYAAFALSNSEERQQVARSFLINVTEFFRDAELFEYLQQEVIPQLLSEARDRDQELRIWSAGCSTGEEAYSLAIAVSECLLESGLDVPVRIFATDLDSDAIAFARKGIFSARSLAKVPGPLVQRYFYRHDEMFEVTKELRAMLIFGEHGLGQRAPFPRIDLVVCRNVLIYFAPALQRHALQLFAFSLRAGGRLVLGKSESAGPVSEYFSLDNSRFRVFRRLDNQAGLPLGMKDVASLSWVPVTSRLPRTPHGGPSSEMTGAHMSNRARMRAKSEEILQSLTAGVVVIDEQYDIQLINAAARRFFGIHTPAIGDDFLHHVATYDANALRRLIDQALGDAESAPLLLQEEGMPSAGGRILEVTATPVKTQNDDEPRVVFVEAIDVTERQRAVRAAELAQTVAERASASSEAILLANLELTSTIASLRAENEELLVAAEEVQAATEEMETLNEELHATNEELETLNEELQATAEELNTANDDLQARTVELQELARVSEERRLGLEAILFKVDRPVVVVDAAGEPIYRNEAFRTEFEERDANRYDGTEGEESLAMEQWLAQLARLELPFTHEFTIDGSDDAARRMTATGRGDFSSGGGRSYIVIEIRPVPATPAEER